jgi:hypothetical protein
MTKSRLILLCVAGATLSIAVLFRAASEDLIVEAQLNSEPSIQGSTVESRADRDARRKQRLKERAEHHKDHQARVDHLRQERAKNFGLLLSHFSGGVGLFSGGPLGWIMGLTGSLLGWAKTFGELALLIAAVVAAGLFMAVAMAVYGIGVLCYRCVRWYIATP